MFPKMPRPYFHKLILPSTIHYKRLRIPENFVRKFKDDLSAAATLAVPSGIVSRVGLRRLDNKVWFYDGWQEFMERYSIRVGYFLVFRYEGNSNFNVFIFNLPSSEISYQPNGLSNFEVHNHSKQYHIFTEMEDEDSEFLDQPTINKTFNPPSFQNLINSSKLSNSVNGASEVNFQRLKVKMHSPDDGEMPNPKKRGRKRKIDPNIQVLSAQDAHEGEGSCRFYESASARKRTVTAEERERAINTAKAFEPSNPFCRVVLRPSYLYKGCIMHLPSCFAEKYLNGVCGFIKLQLSDGKQWPVRCRYKGGKSKLSQGWYEFALENNLGEGDVCVFEVLRAREFVLKVTVFRVMEGAGFMNRLS